MISFSTPICINTTFVANILYTVRVLLQYRIIHSRAEIINWNQCTSFQISQWCTTDISLRAWIHSVLSQQRIYFRYVPTRLTFTRWGCCVLRLWHTPTELAHSFFFFLFLCLFLSLWPFQLYFIPWILPTTLRFLTQFLRSYFCLIGPFNYISLYEGLLQPWYNPLWLTGLKAPTN